MKTVVTIEIDTEKGICKITEENADTIAYRCSDASLEAIAYDAGEALSDYLQGLG